jgi:hypothetical protein
MKTKILMACLLWVAYTPTWAVEKSSAVDKKDKASASAKAAVSQKKDASKPNDLAQKTSKKTSPASTASHTIAKPSVPSKTAPIIANTKIATSKPSTLAEAVSHQQIAGQTNIIATVDTPLVTNIVPWQEQEASIPKSPMEFTALKDTLIATDRDRLTSEIRYTQILNQTSSRQQ